MSATLGAALKKIAVALATDRRNWEKIGIVLLAVLLLFLLPVLSVEAVFQGDFDWDSPELVSAVMEDLDIGSLGFLETSDSLLIHRRTVRCPSEQGGGTGRLPGGPASPSHSKSNKGA